MLSQLQPGPQHPVALGSAARDRNCFCARCHPLVFSRAHDTKVRVFKFDAAERKFWLTRDQLFSNVPRECRGVRAQPAPSGQVVAEDPKDAVMSATNQHLGTVIGMFQVSCDC